MKDANCKHHWGIMPFLRVNRPKIRNPLSWWLTTQSENILGNPIHKIPFTNSHEHPTDQDHPPVFPRPGPQQRRPFPSDHRLALGAAALLRSRGAVLAPGHRDVRAASRGEGLGFIAIYGIYQAVLKGKPKI